MTNTARVDGHSAERLLQDELHPGERLRWRGQPDPSRWLVPGDRFLIPFSLMWGGFAIFWEVAVLSTTTTSGQHRYGFFFALWGVPFVLVGLYLIAGRFLARRYLGARTVYAITDQRALMVTPGWRGGHSLSSVWLAASPPVDQQVARDGHGTVQIGTAPPWPGSFATGDPGWPGRTRTGSLVTFWNITDAREVGALANRLISATRADRAEQGA